LAQSELIHSKHRSIVKNEAEAGLEDHHVEIPEDLVLAFARHPMAGKASISYLIHTVKNLRTVFWVTNRNCLARAGLKNCSPYSFVV
jgi:hypothetical protein